MTSTAKAANSKLLPWVISGVVLAGGVAASLMLSGNARLQEQTALKLQFHAASERAVANLVRKLDTYKVVMRGIQGVFHASATVRHDEFVRYVSALAIPETLSGVQAIAYVAAIPRQQVDSYLQQLPGGLPYPLKVYPDGPSELVAPILYMEPLTESNLKALGFDILSNPDARAAAELARSSGEIVITKPIALIQDANQNTTPSFVMYLPVYRIGSPLGTEALRRKALIGWVDVPFRMTDLMANLRDEINPYLDIEIRDRAVNTDDRLLFHSDDISHQQRGQSGELQFETVIDIGTRQWTILISNTPAFRTNATLPANSSLIAVSGISLSFAFAVLVFFMVRSRDHSERRAARMTHLYHALSEINQSIVRMESENELFPLVCRMAVDFGGMKMAFIGLVDEDNQRVLSVCTYGQNQEHLSGRELSIKPDSPIMRGPTGVVVRTGKPVIINDYLNHPDTAPWHDKARQFGWKSSAAFPIIRQGKTFAILSVYHQNANAFDRDASHLLEEMTSDIGFALDNFDREHQRLQFEQALQESEGRLAAILDNVGASIYLKDLDGRYTFVNQQVMDLLGITDLADILGHTDDQIFDAATTAAVRDNDHRVLHHGETVEMEEISTGKAQGITRIFWSVKIPLRDASGAISGLCGISTDISDSKAREEQIHYLSNYDSLTGLPNRELLSERSKRALAIAKASDSPLALLCLDLNRFKLINESLGHSFGDLVLKQLAQRLTGELHLDTTLSRVGSDEFFLLLPGMNAAQAAAVATELLELIAKPMDLEGRRLTVTSSIGIALFPDHGRNFEQLVQSADAALAMAKQQGRNNFQIFAEAMREQADETLLVENELRDALLNNQLVVHYQPQLDFSTGQITGVEALVRWQHPELGMIPPNKFIPVAEESGLIVEIGAWVLETAARQQAAWRAQGLPTLSVAVNLSVVQLYKDNFCDTVSAVVHKHGLAHSMLELELTERIAMEHSSRTITTLGILHNMGVSLSIDDFGTGYSSLSYLKRYPVHKLKIDKSFVDGLGSDAEDQAIVVAIIGIARGLGFKTTAEGVETLEQWEFLKANGCDAYQGFYFSKAVPAADIEQLLRNQLASAQDNGSTDGNG